MAAMAGAHRKDMIFTYVPLSQMGLPSDSNPHGVRYESWILDKKMDPFLRHIWLNVFKVYGICVTS